MEGEGVRPLDVRLEQVTASLKASLDEVCGTDVQRLDTSESVRIEEVLAIASEAAKEVVSIRRKRRQARRPRASGPGRWTCSLTTPASLSPSAVTCST